METKDKYMCPRISITDVNVDIITYSETEQWVGPTVNSGVRKEPAPENGVN